MENLAHVHQALIEDCHESFEIAADKLLAQSSWSGPIRKVVCSGC